MNGPTAAGPLYLHIRGFHANSASAAQLQADAQGMLASADARGLGRPSAAGSPIKTLAEWHDLLGDPPVIGHPLTHEKEPVPLHLFADRDPETFLLTISWVQYSQVMAEKMSLPPAGEPIIEVLDN